MDKLHSLLCLMSVDGLGPHRIRRLVSHFDTFERVRSAEPEALCRIGGLNGKLAHNIKKGGNPRFADEQIRRARGKGVSLISFWDPGYPAILKEIYDPPVLLFVRGELPEEPGISIVGMRYPSRYGSDTARMLGKAFSDMNIPVISGMARGIDSWAHRGVLDGQGKTVAVLGSGIDVIYPPENGPLSEKIAGRGAVISEFPMGAEPAAGHFPRRNRIISGLSRGTIVVEAGEKSGALITAYMALEQGREVFAVPGPVSSMKSQGPHRLIREGARLIESADDVIAEIAAFAYVDGKERRAAREDQPLTVDEQKIWDMLSDTPIHVDSLSEKTNMPVSEILCHLLSMELKNRVKQISGMRFVR